MQLVINHLTRMQQGCMCTAGIDLATGLHVRPVLDRQMTIDMLSVYGGPFDIGRIVAAWAKGLVVPAHRADPDYRLAWCVIIGSIPIGVVGVLFKDEIRSGVRNLWVIAIAMIVFLAASAWILSQLFAGRALYLQLGAMLGTMMAANVLFVIIPSQRQLVIAKEQGRTVVIVSHDERIKDIADRVLWLEDGQFKDMVTMAVDPVCGMTVARETALAAGRDGTTYFFCSRGCRAEFLGTLDATTSPSGTV